MTPVTLDKEYIEATEEEEKVARSIESVLRKKGMAGLVGPSGERIELPPAAFEVLRRAVHLLGQGRAVAIIPYSKMLTTQQAAELLNVSRPYVVKLLETGEIPFEKVGSHRRIQFSDLMAYRQRRDKERHKSLDRITRASQELGLYDKG